MYTMKEDDDYKIYYKGGCKGTFRVPTAWSQTTDSEAEYEL